MILLLISFVAGVLTVLAPCTISLLPVIVGGSISEGHSSKRALVVTASLGASVILFTLILKVSTLFINIPQSFWQIFSGIIILVIGFAMIFPDIWERIPFMGKLNIGSNRLLATGYKKNNIAGDVIMGAALGPVFSTCSPTYFLILATVLPKSVAEGIIYLLAYVVGLCGFLLIITILSQKAVEKLGLASDSRGWFKRVVGVIFLILGIAIIFGLDQKIELAISNKVFDVTSIEQMLLANQVHTNNPANNFIPGNPDGSNSSSSQSSPNTPGVSNAVGAKTPPTAQALSEENRIKIKSLQYTRAPEITNPSGFVNTNGQPITFASFKGKKVVLVDFWTYSCINCQRTIPYLNAWYKKYADQGLEIVGIHTPEFAFEKVLKNVEDGVARFGIKYPVVLDNDYGTWNAFGNQYWPRDYLIDIDGFVVHDHAGEGDYDKTEQAIQTALAERASILGTGQVSSGIVAPADAVNMDASKISSPETYFGSNRNEFLANGTKSLVGVQTLTIPTNISLNNLYLSGAWNLNPEYAETKDTSAKIVYKYSAKDLYFVASSEHGANLKILLDGKPIKSAFGADVKSDGTAFIKENRLYKIVQGTDYGEHTIEIDVINGTLDAYTFTFG
jgi:cytochrome c biogenesis protein CcdA/thiol-disulfide isomerase/thioredoxin